MIFDMDNNIIENPDLTIGRLNDDTTDVVLRYIIDKKQESHYEVIAEYPNGGKDVAEIIDVPESGHWIVLHDGEEVDWKFDVPDDWPKESDIAIPYSIQRYILYTEDELAEIEQRKKEAEDAAAKKAEQDAFLGKAPERLDEAECMIVEAQDALAELGVIAADNLVSNDEVMDAIAELGVIVSELSGVVANLQKGM